LFFKKIAHGNKSVAVSDSIQVRKEDEEDVPWAEDSVYYLETAEIKNPVKLMRVFPLMSVCFASAPQCT